MIKKQGYVYIMFNKEKGTLYTGVTSNLVKRIYEHKTQGDSKSFTSKYKIYKLGYYETFSDIKSAIEREKQIKAGSRQDKIDLIIKENPNWNDLYNNIL